MVPVGALHPKVIRNSFQLPNTEKVFQLEIRQYLHINRMQFIGLDKWGNVRRITIEPRTYMKPYNVDIVTEHYITNESVSENIDFYYPIKQREATVKELLEKFKQDIYDACGYITIEDNFINYSTQFTWEVN